MTDQVGASHILVMHKESERSSATRTKSEALELINDIKKQVEVGEDFPALAKEHSDCPSSNDRRFIGNVWSWCNGSRI